MKKKFKYRSALSKVLTELGIKDTTMIQERTESTTKHVSFELINPQRRVLKTLLALPLERQKEALDNFRSQAQSRQKDNDLLENS